MPVEKYGWKIQNITSKYFNFFNNKPLENWVTHITRDFLTCYFCSFCSFMIWFCQHKRKWAVVSGSEPQLRIGFVVSAKLRLNLCSFMWLKLSLKRISDAMPLLSWIAKTEFSEVFTKLNNGFLNDIGEGNDFISSLKLFCSWEQCGKNVLLKLNVLDAVFFTIFFAVDLVGYMGLFWSWRCEFKYLGESPFTIL